jgi:hypothetical protein
MEYTSHSTSRERMEEKSMARHVSKCGIKVLTTMIQEVEDLDQGWQRHGTGTDTGLLSGYNWTLAGWSPERRGGITESRHTDALLESIKPETREQAEFPRI